MSVQRYKNGAWAIPTLKRYKDGAWVDVTSIKRYINGAWTEVWKISPTGSLFSALVGFVNPEITTYSYSVSSDGTALTYTIRNAVAGNNNVPFMITKNGGFGKTIKLKYTVTQTVEVQAYASSRWLNKDFDAFTNTFGMWYNYQSCSETTFEGTMTVSEDQPYIYLLIEAYEYGITGTIKNVYINDELVLFK